LAPAVPWLVARISVLSSRLRSPLSYIATTELRAAPTRATALAATSAIAVFAIVALGGAANDIRRGAANASYDIAGDSALLVWPGPFDEYPFPVQPLDATTALARLRSVSAISRVDVLRGSFLDLGDRRLLVIAKPLDDSTPVSSSQIIEGSARRAAALIRQGGWVALSEIVAAERHVHVGGRLLLPTPSGYEAFRLAATITNYGWPPGAMVMSATDYIRDWHTERATGLRVFLRQGIAEDTGLRAVRAALSGTGLFVNTTRRAEADIKSVTNQGLSQLNQISLLVLAAAILAVVAAMSGSIWQRRPRLAGLRRLGLYRWELIRTIYLETGVVVVVGCTIGAGFGLGAQPIATGYVRQSTGFPEIYSPAVWLGVRTLAVATILAMLATGVLGYVVTRRSLGWRSEA
jgi:putative ABC transport system permease protein